jgi:hypothetical protein
MSLAQLSAQPKNLAHILQYLNQGEGRVTKENGPMPENWSHAPKKWIVNTAVRFSLKSG